MSTISLLLAIIMVLMGFMPQMAQAHAIEQHTQQIKAASYSAQIINQPFSPTNSALNSFPLGIGIDLQALLDATTDSTDTDGDGLPDSVEWVLGTDPENPDSDFDTLDDYYEAANGLDPQKADSNGDGLVDNLEIKDVTWDFDDDGIPNVWDSDNDNDGVPDNLDRSPFAKSTTGDSFQFNIQTNGNPTYVDFQIKPENTEHLKLPLATWDWPEDTEGQMQDRDGSVDDVQVLPMLELTLNSRPEQSEVEDYGIVVPQEEENIGGFEVHGITIANVDDDLERDLILFGGTNSADTILPGYIIGWDMDYLSDDPIVPSRWSPVKDQTWPVGSYWDDGVILDKIISDYPDLYVLRSGDWPIRDIPLMIGAAIDNLGNPQSGADSLNPILVWNSSYGPVYSVGSGLDIADIDGNGIKDLLATYVIEGTNELAYIIGWDLDNTLPPTDLAYGAPTAISYSPPISIMAAAPHYFGNPIPIKEKLPSIPEIGTDISNISVEIRDIDGNGTRDWLLMGTNYSADQVHYMIGWDLNTSGIPTSWSDIITSPKIDGGAAGGGAAIAYFNDNQRPDLLLLAVDNAEKHNYHYIIGWDIDITGNVASWSPVKYYVDDYDGFVTRGLAIGDVNGNGDPDLVFLGGNDAADPDRPGYIIGWDFNGSDILISPSQWSPIKKHPWHVGDYLGAGAFTDLNGNGEPEIYMPFIGNEENYGGIYSDSFCFGVDLDSHGDQQKPGEYWDLSSMWAYFSYSGDPVISAGSGLDIADIDGNGTPDLLSAFILEETSELAYLIGWNLESEHSPHGGDVFGLASAWSYSLPLTITGAFYG